MTVDEFAAMCDERAELDTDRVAHVVAVAGTQDDPVRLTLCGVTLTDARHTAAVSGMCVVCAALKASLVARGLR